MARRTSGGRTLTCRCRTPIRRCFPSSPTSRSARRPAVSSTTERRDERGQILAIFAGAAAVIMLIAALAFDTGTVLVEKRDQQNAADAAALAGARFLPGNTTSAVARAAEIADLNGFVDGVGTTDVDIEVGSWSGTTFSTGGTNAI